jgi:hypothetical protein
MRSLIARSPVAGSLLAGAAALWISLTPQGVAAQGSDDTAGLIVVPKVLVRDPSLTHPTGIDTLIQLTNTRNEPVSVQCYYVNANGYCGSDEQRPCWEDSDCTIVRECVEGTCNPGTSSCETAEDCRPLLQACVPGWVPSPDFFVTLTSAQPIGWSAKTGLISGRDDLPCFGLLCGTKEEQNFGDVVGVGSPFRGELKCVQLDADDNPAAANDLKIEATILRATLDETQLAASAYNGVGFEAVSAASSLQDRTGGVLCLGDKPAGESLPCAANYAPCPNVLIAEHFFDGAQLPNTNAQVKTSLTLVPCSENLQEASLPPKLRVQMLVYNEFEQRFSTGADVQCYRDTLLSDIDTIVGNPSDDRFSVFSIYVQGTMTGQTRMRGVQGPPGAHGYGIIGVIEEHYSATENPGRGPIATAAYDLQFDIGSSRGDAIRIRPRIGGGD